MDTKKIIFASVIIGVAFMVLFSPQKVESQEIHAVTSTGYATTVFFDYTLSSDCRNRETIHASGDSFTPNVDIDVYISQYPENGNADGKFEDPDLIIPMFPPAFTNHNAIIVDGNGNFNTQFVGLSPVPGNYNLVAVTPVGSESFDPEFDTIDILDGRGFMVQECVPRQEIDLYKLSKQLYGDRLLSMTDNDGTTRSYVTSIINAGVQLYKEGSGGKTLDTTGVYPAVYVMYPNDDSQFSAGGEHQILIPSVNSSPDNKFGHSLAGGDFNGDGYGDLVVGIPDEYENGKDDAGAINVFHGTSSGRYSSDPQVITTADVHVSVKKDDNFGWSLAVGDFNGDNYDDLAIGIPNHPINGHSEAGMVSVIYGSENGLDPDKYQKWYQSSKGIHGASEKGDKFGYTLATGDFDNNGHDDLAIGVPNEDIAKKKNAGAVNVIYGGLGPYGGGLSSTYNKIWYQGVIGIKGASETNDYFGKSLATGDFDNNGHDDLAIGVPWENVSGVVNAGAVNVIYGGIDSHSRLSSVQDDIWYQGIEFDITGSLETGDTFGYSLATGDFNDDGRDDLAIGVPWEDVGSKADAGAVNVIYGSNNGLSPYENQLWYQDTPGMLDTSESNDHYGYSLTVGDFDNDGIGDLSIGIPYKDIDGILDVGATSTIYGERAPSWKSIGGLNADGNQYWHPGG